MFPSVHHNHLTRAAHAAVDSWAEGQRIDLDAECRHLTVRALGRSAFGIDLGQRAGVLDESLRRASNPVHSAALRELADDVLAAYRADRELDAPLVRALLQAQDPETGKGLTDTEIREELVAFFAAAYDRTATALTRELWRLSRDPQLQETVRAEAADDALSPALATIIGRSEILSEHTEFPMATVSWLRAQTIEYPCGSAERPVSAVSTVSP